MMNYTKHLLLVLVIGAGVPKAFGAAAEIRNVDASFAGDEVRIDIELTSPVTPRIQEVSNPSRLIIYFPNVSLGEQSRQIPINRNGVNEVHVGQSPSAASGTLLNVGLDSARPFGIEASGNKVILSILPHPQAGASPAAATNLGAPRSAPSRIQPSRADEKPAAGDDPAAAGLGPGRDQTQDAGPELIARASIPPVPDVEHMALESVVEAPRAGATAAAAVRHRFRVKFISGKTAYIDGGTNAGLRIGMDLDIRDPHEEVTAADPSSGPDTAVATAHIVGVATTSAITEIGEANGDLRVGDWADLTAADAAVASRNVLAATSESFRAPSSTLDEDRDSMGAAQIATNHLRSTDQADTDVRSRMAGRIGFDYSGITSDGSTPGTSTQLGISFQSDMTHILGTHWNLQGYWRARTNQHSQFEQETIDDTLNKTYTMQLYYENPDSRWAAGVGRLYLPWAVSLDTIDGGYVGFKPKSGMTTGIFAGSTPDLSSWHYRPNQRIGGWFMSFEGGDYEGFHYSSTSGAALSSIGWKLDRPFIFFENEASYKGRFSTYHSMVVDSPQGVTTNGIRPGPGISRSYFTFHYIPNRVVSLDLYHNYFRDVPTALTSIVGTGLVDKLLFQGINGGVRVKPIRRFTLYSTIGTSAKTGDLHRSLNQMYGATWNEIWHTGLRADFHYSKFDSNFAEGNYRMVSLSRQLTNRMYWNAQVGAQHVESAHTMDCDSVFFDDSLDFNLGRHSYLQSGYTYVNGETMNYRQWYLSWGYRFDQGKSNPAFVQSLQGR